VLGFRSNKKRTRQSGPELELPMFRILKILVIPVCALTHATQVLADIDPKSFPADIRAYEWREIGPWRGGRSAAVAGTSSQRETYYFGATGGGVWKTRDGGKSWENVSDGYFGGSIGAVAVSEWDSNVIFVGGGE
jgi:hypothetical protein